MVEWVLSLLGLILGQPGFCRRPAMPQIRVLILAVAVWMAHVSIFAQDRVGPTPHLLRGGFSEAIDELSLLPGGKVIHCYFSVASDSDGFVAGGKTIVPEWSQSLFGVEILHWDRGPEGLRVGRPDQMIDFHWEADPKHYIFGEFVYFVKKHLFFFSLLKQFCGDSAFEMKRMTENEEQLILKDLTNGQRETFTIANRFAARSIPGRSNESFKPPTRFLHINTETGFIEYELRSDGVVVAYYDNERRVDEKTRNAPLVHPRPLLEIKLFRWKLDAGKLNIDHGDFQEAIDIAPGQTPGEQGWVPVEHLDFVSRLLALSAEEPSAAR